MSCMKRFSKLFAVLLVVLLLLSGSLPAFAAGPILGDMDGDGFVTTADARIVLRIASGIDALPEGKLSIADADGDGFVTVADARIVLQTAVGVGTNMISDSAENSFIKLIASKYGVSPSLLVAIYAVPDKGDNFVLQFSGKKDSSGKLIRSPDTLKKVYHIDASKNIQVATGTLFGNEGCNVAESYVVVKMIKEHVMPMYPDYFSE